MACKLKDSHGSTVLLLYRFVHLLVAAVLVVVVVVVVVAVDIVDVVVDDDDDDANAEWQKQKQMQQRQKKEISGKAAKSSKTTLTLNHVLPKTNNN